MPYKKKGNWIAQVRKNGKRKEKQFQTKKAAVSWENKMREKLYSNWQKDTTCLADWANQYLSYSEKMYVIKTYDEKRSVFKRFFKEINPTISVNDMNSAMVLKYLQNQLNVRSGYGANKDRKNLLAGWNWGIKYMAPKLPSPNPFLVEKMPEQRSPRYIPPEKDFWKVFNLTQGQDRVMLLTALHLAARRNELFKIKWTDVDFDNLRIRLWTRKRKGGVLESDLLPMTNELNQALLSWKKAIPVKGKEHVFICLEKTPFCKEYFGNPFRERQHFLPRLCEKAGVKNFGFHAIRHFTASSLYKLGCNLSEIQAILRHKSPSTTERYLKSLGIEAVRSSLEKFSDHYKGIISQEAFIAENLNRAEKKAV